MWIFKVLAFIWPFIKEMVLGDKTLKEAIQDNKTKVLFAGIVMLSFALNFFAVTRLVVISKDFVVLQKKYTASTKLLEEMSHSLEKTKKKDPVPILEAKKDDPPLDNVPDIPLVTHAPPVATSTKPVIAKVIKKPTVGPSNADRYSKMKDNFDKIKEREDKAGQN